MATIDDNVTRARQRLDAAKRAKDPAGVRAAQAALNTTLAEQKQRTGLPAQPPTAPATTPDTSAIKAVQSQLDAYGLGSLAPKVWQQWLDGVPIERIVAGLPDTAEYKARFPGLDKMRQEGRGISEQQWVQYEQTARGVLRSYGLPESFYDQPSDFAAWIDKGVDAPELERRVSAASTVITSLPASVRDAAVAEGVSLGDLTAFWLDPDVAEPIIKQKVARWQVQGAAKDAGWNVSGDRADSLAARGLDYAGAKSAFDQASTLLPLTAQQVSDTTTLSRGDVESAVVDNNSDARRRVQKRAESNTARGVQGGGYAGNTAGVAGLGSASR